LKEEGNNLFLVIHRARSNEEPASEIRAVLMVNAQKCWKIFLGIIISIIVDYWRPLKTGGQTSLGRATQQYR